MIITLKKCLTIVGWFIIPLGLLDFIADFGLFVDNIPSYVWDASGLPRALMRLCQNLALGLLCLFAARKLQPAGDKND